MAKYTDKETWTIYYELEECLLKDKAPESELFQKVRGEVAERRFQTQEDALFWRLKAAEALVLIFLMYGADRHFCLYLMAKRMNPIMRIENGIKSQMMRIRDVLGAGRTLPEDWRSLMASDMADDSDVSRLLEDLRSSAEMNEELSEERKEQIRLIESKIDEFNLDEDYKMPDGRKGLVRLLEDTLTLGCDSLKARYLSGKFHIDLRCYGKKKQGAEEVEVRGKEYYYKKFKWLLRTGESNFMKSFSDEIDRTIIIRRKV